MQNKLRILLSIFLLINLISPSTVSFAETSSIEKAVEFINLQIENPSEETKDFKIKNESVDLKVPKYDQPSQCCWASCMAMWVSYLNNDRVNRTVDIAKYCFGKNWNQAGGWISFDELPFLQQNNKQETVYVGDESKETIVKYIIDSLDAGQPIGLMYHSNTSLSGHIILVTGYENKNDLKFIINDPNNCLKTKKKADGIMKYKNLNLSYIVIDSLVFINSKS